MVYNRIDKEIVAHKVDYIDVYRGISILCITLLHYEQGVFPAWLNVFIGSFMIAAFYLVSGWVMGQKEEQPKTSILVKKRLKSLGVPYLSFTIILLCFDLILCIFNYYDIYFVAREVYKSITLRGIGTLWFLPALFFGEILLSLIIKRRWWWQLLLLLAALAYASGYGYWCANFRNLSDATQIIDAPFRTINSALQAFVILLYSYYASLWYKRYVKGGTPAILKL